MRWMRTRLKQEEGFTLIELMVVVLIIAVLVAIAVPSFLGFRNRAQDRASQADLRNVLVAEKAYWTDFGDYAAGAADITNGTVTQSAEAWLKTYEPGIVIDTGTALAALTSDTAVHVEYADSSDVLCIVSTSDSGNVFVILEDATASGGTYYGAFEGEGNGVCPATAAAAGGTAGFQLNGFGTPLAP